MQKLPARGHPGNDADMGVASFKPDPAFRRTPYRAILHNADGTRFASMFLCDVQRAPALIAVDACVFRFQSEHRPEHVVSTVEGTYVEAPQ